MERISTGWRSIAAYLYILHLEGSCLAWEYLRRHPDYGRDWLAHQGDVDVDSARWGLRLFEDPALDARSAHPIWLHDPHGVALVQADCDPPNAAAAFRLWRLPGRKRLMHDGYCLRVALSLPARVVRLSLSPRLKDGMACAYAVKAGTGRGRGRCECDLLRRTLEGAAPAGRASPRPGRSGLVSLRTLQALDGALAGASLREIAGAVFGEREVRAHWHADGALRAQVRHLVERGRLLMHGGYLRLAGLEQGDWAGRDQPP